MDIIGKDVVGLIFDYCTPTDWVCTSLVCKSWWKTISKFMTVRKKLFFIKLQREIELYGIDITSNSHDKNNFCIRPMYYLKGKDDGCLGNISNYICARHKNFSIYSREICHNCKVNPVYPECFEKRCDSINCRDYMFILRDGLTIRVKGYRCISPGCRNLTDVKEGKCYQHGLLHKQKYIDTLTKYNCTSLTKTGRQCSNTTTSRLRKCHCHVASPLSYL